MIQTFILQASPFKAENIATVVGLAALLTGVTAVFVDLQDGLNTVWDLRLKPENGLTPPKGIIPLCHHKRLHVFSP